MRHGCKRGPYPHHGMVQKQTKKKAAICGGFQRGRTTLLQFRSTDRLKFYREGQPGWGYPTQTQAYSPPKKKQFLNHFRANYSQSRFGGIPLQIISGLSPKRDCGSVVLRGFIQHGQNPPPPPLFPPPWWECLRPFPPKRVGLTHPQRKKRWLWI